MAQVTQYISDFSGKPVKEDDLSSIRIQDGSGQWFRLDGTSDEIEGLLGKALDNGTNITSEVMIENDQKIARAIKAKIEAGELFDTSARSSARKTRSDAGVSAGGSGLSPEEKSALRSFWRDNAEEIKEKLKIEFNERGRFPQQVQDMWTEKGKPGV